MDVQDDSSPSNLLVVHGQVDVFDSLDQLNMVVACAICVNLGKQPQACLGDLG